MVTGSSASITLTASSGTLACNSNPLTASSGVATFAGVPRGHRRLGLQPERGRRAG